jgi:hypothetical protein
VDEPKNDLEAALFKGSAGSETQAFLAQLLRSIIFVPSSTEVQADGRGLDPIVYDRSGVKMVAAFTNMDRIEPRHVELAKFCLQIEASWFIKNMPREMGIVLLAGDGRGCELMPHALAELRSRL